MKKKSAMVVSAALALSILLSACGGQTSSGGGAGAGTSGAAAPAGTQASTPKSGSAEKFTIGTGSTGSNFFIAGSAVAALVNDRMAGVYDASVEVTAASAGNVALMQEGEIAFGMCATDTAWEAYNGKFDYEGMACDRIRTVAPAYSGVYMFITAPSTGVEKLTDFNGKSYSGGTLGSANSVATNRAFELFGISATVTNLPNTEAATGLGDGTLAGFTHSYPSSVLAEFETTHDSRIILMNEEEKKLFLETYPQYLWLSIPAGVYKGLPDGGENIGLYSLLMASSDTDEELVYQVTKLIYENPEYWEAAYAQMAKDLSPENLGMTTVPYHAGAIRYFREKGYEIPAELIPPECQ